MALRRDSVPNLANLPVRADPESHAHDSKEGFPQKRLHPPRTVRFDDVKFRIRQQRKIQLVLYLELRLRLNGIRAASHDRRIQFVKLFDGVTKLGRFTRSTGCVCFRIKIQDHVFPAKVLERNRLAIVGRLAEIRRLVAFLEHHASPFQKSVSVSASAARAEQALALKYR